MGITDLKEKMWEAVYAVVEAEGEMIRKHPSLVKQVGFTSLP